MGEVVSHMPLFGFFSPDLAGADEDDDGVDDEIRLAQWQSR